MRASGGLRRRLEVGSANVFDLGLELLRILFRGVEPHFLAVRLNGCLLEKTADLGHRNIFHDLPRERLVTQFSERPVVDRPARQLRRFARQRHDLGHLRGSKRGRGTQSRSVAEQFEDRLTQTVGFGTFPHTQRRPGIPPTLPPKAHLEPVQADTRGDLLVKESLEAQLK